MIPFVLIFQEKGEQATSHLVLITLNNSWRKLKKQQQEILQTEIFAKLKSFTVHPTLVSMSVDIATGITVLSAENELAGKKEIAKWAMELIQVFFLQRNIYSNLFGSSSKPENLIIENQKLIYFSIFLGL